MELIVTKMTKMSKMVIDNMILSNPSVLSYLYRALKSGQQKQTFGPRIVNSSFVTDLHVFKPNLRTGGEF